MDFEYVIPVLGPIPLQREGFFSFKVHLDDQPLPIGEIEFQVVLVKPQKPPSEVSPDVHCVSTGVPCDEKLHGVSPFAVMLEAHSEDTVGSFVTMIGTLEPDKTKKLKLRQEVAFLVEFLPQPGSAYVVNVPALPAGSTQGRTREEAENNVRDNLEGLLEDVVNGELFYEKTPEFFGLPEYRAIVRVPHP